MTAPPALRALGSLAIALALLNASPARAQLVPPASPRWTFEVPPGHALAAWSRNAEYDLLRVEDRDVAVHVIETPVHGDVDVSTAAWWVDADLGPSAGRTLHPLLRCEALEEEVRAAPAPRLLWPRCTFDRRAALQHPDGRWTILELVRDDDEVRAFVRSARPVAGERGGAVSDSTLELTPVDGHELFHAGRGANEGLWWITEVAAPGARELAITVSDAGWWPGAIPQGDDKLIVAARTRRGRVTHDPFDVGVELVLHCPDGRVQLLAIGGSAVAGAEPRLLRMLAELRVAPDAGVGCTLSQPARLKPDLPRSTGLGCACARAQPAAIPFASVTVVLYGLRARRRRP